MALHPETQKMLKAQADMIRQLADMIEQGDTVIKVEITPLTQYQLSGVPFRRTWAIGVELAEDPEAFLRNKLEGEQGGKHKD